MQTEFEFMDKRIKDAVENYQCPGCTNGHNIKCYDRSLYGGVGCSSHSAGTWVSSIGKIFLGMPHGFNRLGPYDTMKMEIFNEFDPVAYNLFNVVVWKHLNKNGHTIVRGLCPRTNVPFLHVILENCMDKFYCVEITEEHIKVMD